MDIKKQIAELQKKGFNKSQAGIIALAQQGGNVNYNYDKTGNTNITPQEASMLARNAGGMGLEFTPDFAQSYFSRDTPVAPVQAPIDYSTYPVLDITSDGQFTDRKVWRTQRPEWFVGKQEPVEGRDYTTIPHKQWKQYQNSPEYSIFRKKATQVASLQQGGYWGTNNPYFMENPGMSQNVPNPTYAQQYLLPSQPTYGSLPTNLPPNQGYQPTDYSNYAQNLQQNNPVPNNFSQYSLNESNIPSSTLNSEVVNPLADNAGSGYQTDDYGNPIQSQPYGGGNIFGGTSTDMGLYMFGQGLGERNPYKTAVGGSLTALKLGRVGIGGYASGKENRRVEDEYRRKLYADNRPITNFQQGGSITNAEALTGSYAVGNPNTTSNVIVENGEHIKNNQTGEIKEAVGENHKNGGIPISLEDGKVLSDFTKIGAKNAKELKERYNLSLKKTDTFAKVMDKINKQIGIDKLTDEQAKAIEKLGDNEYIKDQTTKTLNEKLLTKQVEESQAKLEDLKGAQNFAFEDIFAMQEKIPKRGGGELINPDGSPMEVKEQEPTFQQGGHIYDLAKKHNISPERAQQLMQMGGETAPQEQAQQMPSPDEIIQAFAQATQQDPQVIAEQLQQLAPEAQQQALESMVAQLQQQSALAQEQVPVEEALIEEQEMMQQGGGYSFSTRYMPQSKDYVTEGSSILDQDVLSGVEEFQPYTGKGYGAKMADVAKTIDTHSWYFDTDKKKKDFTEAVLKKGRQPEIVAFQEAYNKELEKRADSAGVPKTEIDNIKKEVGFADKGVQKVDGLFGAFTSTRPLYNFSKNNGDVSARPEFNQGQMVENVNAVPQDTSIGFQPYITPPSGRKGVILETVQSPQYDRIKRSFEAGESAIASQADTKRQQVEATGLAPQIQEAILAGDLATSQAASNQNIASVEGFNAQNAQQVQNMQANSDFKTNLFNLGKRDEYFVRNTIDADNAEKAQAMYNDDYNRLGYRTYKDNMERSLINATADNYRINNNGSLTFLEPRSQFVGAGNKPYWDWYNTLPASDQEFERRRMAQETLDKVNAEKKTNAIRK